MRKIITFLIIFTFAFSQQISYYILKINSHLRELKESNAKEETPYLYGKVKGYEEGMKIYAKYGDEKGVEKAYKFLEENTEKAVRGAYTGREPYTELIIYRPKVRYIYLGDGITEEYYVVREKEKQELLDLVSYDALRRRVEFLKIPHAKYCAPLYYGKSEALFNLISYELSRKKPNQDILLDLKGALEKNLVMAEELVRYAMNKKLDCYMKR
ncbi:hypothetical protein [Aquifex sp.]